MGLVRARDATPCHSSSRERPASAKAVNSHQALSTLNFLRAGPKLRFKAEPVARASFLEPTADFVQTEVTNVGGRPTTLTSITIRYFNNQWSWARLRNRPTKEAVFYDRYPVQPLPYELKPGGVWRGSCVLRGSTPQADLAASIGREMPYALAWPARLVRDASIEDDTPVPGPRPPEG
jgi:hypothetical protein